MIIFDFDGTLADSIGLGYDLVNSYADEMGYIQVSREKGMGLSVPQIMKEAHIRFYELPKLVLFFRKKLAENSDKIKMIDGVMELLTKLRNQGYKLGIITSNSADCVSHFLKKYNIEDFFSYIRTDVSMFGKPRALKQTKKLLKKNFVYVGDELRDVEACRKIKIPVVSVPWGFNSADVLEKANPGLVARDSEAALSLINKQAEALAKIS